MKVHSAPITPFDMPKMLAIFKKSFTEDICTVKDFINSWECRSKEHSRIFYINEGCIFPVKKTIGFVICTFYERNGDSMYMNYFALAPEVRGTGIGTSILKDILKKCYDENGSIHLCPAKEDLEAWYERNGFRWSNKNYYVFHSYGTRAQGKAHKALGFCASVLLNK
jgi:GNAT superfamily N-acetyltransferase